MTWDNALDVGRFIGEAIVGIYVLTTIARIASTLDAIALIVDAIHKKQS